MKLRVRFNRIKKKYPKITRQKHLYRVSGDLKRKHNRIKTYNLLYQEGYGHTILMLKHKRGSKESQAFWNQWIKDHEMNILLDSVLPGIFSKYGQQWIFKAFIGWAWDL